MGLYDNLQSYYREKYQAEQAQAQAAQPPPADERAYLHTATAGAWLPLAQAAALGLAWGVLALLIAWLCGLPRPWAWGLGAWAAILALTLTGLLWRWLRLTQPIEQLTGLDLNQDGYVGPPPFVRIELAQKTTGGTQTVIANLPTSQAKLTRLAQGLQAGLSLAEGVWTGSNGPFSKAEYRALRAELQARGMIEPASEKGNSQGYALTPAGRAAMRYFASLAAAPSPALAEHIE